MDARHRRRILRRLPYEEEEEAEAEAEDTLGGSELIAPPPELRARRHVARAVVVRELLPLAHLRMSHYRFVLPLIHFTSYSLKESIP